MLIGKVLILPLALASFATASVDYILTGSSDTVVHITGSVHPLVVDGGTDAIIADGYYRGITVTSTGLALKADAGYGNGLGIEAIGATGVEASGTHYGVLAQGVSRGVYGGSSGGYGVQAVSTSTSGVHPGLHATGAYYGVMGFITDQWEGAAVYGKGHTNGAWAAWFDGNTYATGTYQGSDIALKKNIRPLQDGLGKVMALRPKVYEMKTKEFEGKLSLPEGTKMGLIAQEVETVFPELVKSVAMPAIPNGDSHGAEGNRATTKFKAVDYTSLIPVLIQAIQEQQAEIEELKQALGR